MLRRAFSVAVIVLCAALAAGAAFQPSPHDAGLVVHEWGTFTTVAGEDGQAVNWIPLGGPTDLPCFVEHFKSRQFKVLLTDESEVAIDYETARSRLVGTVRMETPVVYFYAPSEMTASVSVRFPRGLITEWYPSAVVNQPDVFPSSLSFPSLVGGVDWPSIRVTPGQPEAFPRAQGASHYYAARATDASPLRVGGQQEKFLFYRGVAGFPALVSAELLPSDEVRVVNLGPEPIPTMMILDSHAGRVSFTTAQALSTRRTIARPTASADQSAIRAEFSRALVAAGLYQKEADAMVATWRDSWFEEGTRVFYVVPAAAVDRILPLTVTPAPSATARVFVGRMEVITPEAMAIVQTAIAARDAKTLERYGRFLGPIADRLGARMSSVSDRQTLRATTNQMFADYVARTRSCQ